MNRDELKALIINELGNIAPEVEAQDIPDNQDLREAIELDSMDFLNLVIAVCKATKTTIPEADYPLVVSLNGMVNYLFELTNE